LVLDSSGGGGGGNEKKALCSEQPPKGNGNIRTRGAERGGEGAAATSARRDGGL